MLSFSKVIANCGAHSAVAILADVVSIDTVVITRLGVVCSQCMLYRLFFVEHTVDDFEQKVISHQSDSREYGVYTTCSFYAAAVEKRSANTMLTLDCALSLVMARSSFACAVAQRHAMRALFTLLPWPCESYCFHFFESTIKSDEKECSCVLNRRSCHGL
jgi:hypothetical protein